MSYLADAIAEEVFEPRVLYPAKDDYPITWKETAKGVLTAFYINPETGEEIEAAWAPQYGGQYAFMMATCIFEVLCEGNRGWGKTDSLLMDFAQHVGKGYGAEWRGILFRQTYPQLSDVIAKSKKWFKTFWPKAKYNKVDHSWEFPTGEVLLLRHMNSEDDYWNYHGHAYPWIAWEELCNWATDKCYKVMMSCCRSTVPGMPRCYRGTTNPYGPGHNWVKSRFRLPQSRGIVITDSMVDGEVEPPRVAVHGTVFENLILMLADPEYIPRIRAAARNPSELAAWIEGSWDITAGGMFDDIWRGQIHAVPGFPSYMVPRGWKIDRSFDWGSSKPFAVCWWAESNGEPFEYNGRLYGQVAGDLYQIEEWYGWNGTRNEGVKMIAADVGKGIADREEDWGLRQRGSTPSQDISRVKPGPADASIFDEVNGNNIGKDLAKAGAKFNAADKGPGSRKQGWEMIRKMLSRAIPPVRGIREEPGLYIFDRCKQTLETFPSLPRDLEDLDDVDTEMEDHIGDAIRYRVRKKLRAVKQT